MSEIINNKKKDVSQKKGVSQKKAIKHFWKYTVILFASAMILIIIAGAIQTYNLQEYMNANEVEASTNKSALQSVKEINDALTVQLEGAKKELEALKSESELNIEAYEHLETKLSQMLIIMDTQRIYISGGRKSAKESLSRINKEDLNEDLITAYNFIYDKLY